ncbi:flagellar hook-length control protein FliK [Azotobacter armeniacus]
MDIIALPASPPSGAAASATPPPPPSSDTNGFARSLDQAAGRQVHAEASTPEARTVRTAAAEMPTAPAGTPLPLATPSLPGLSLARSTGSLSGQEEKTDNPQANETSKAPPTDLAGMLLPGAPIPTLPAVSLAVPGSPEAGTPDNLQRIRSRLQAIESAGQLAVPDPTGQAQALPATAADAAGNPATTTDQSAQSAIPPLQIASGAATIAAPAAGPAANAGQPLHQTAPDGAEQTEPTASIPPAGTGQPEFAGNERASYTLPPSETVQTGDSLPDSIEGLPGNGGPLPLTTHSPSAGGFAMGGSSAAANLTAPLASPEWQRGLGQQLLNLQQRGEQEIELHLHPAELGPLSISLKLGESTAQAQFLSAHPQVRAAVEQAIPQLREALAEQGITLGEASVGEQQQQPRGGQETPNGRSGGWQLGSADEGSRLEANTPPVARTNGGIDLYA